jgi:putative flippase GtrA
MKKVFLQLLNKPLIGLLFRYGIVGVVASLTHYLIAYLCYSEFQLNYLVAHFFGFLFGLFTAYFGHYFYSFKDIENHSKRFPKFLVLSLAALILHQGGAYGLVNFFHFDYKTRVLPLLIVAVPIFTFLLNKFWVFSSVDKLR